MSFCSSPKRSPLRQHLASSELANLQTGKDRSSVLTKALFPSTSHLLSTMMYKKRSGIALMSTNTTPCFALSATAFLPDRPKICNTCRRSPQRVLSIRRVRAATTEADAESPQDVDIGQQEDQSAFEEQVPGKMVLNELELAQQRTALEQYAKELRQKRIAEEIEAARLFGFVPYAETLNGRLAMFFLVTGLLTEYWTGYTIPEQVELMLRTLGVI